MKRNSDYNKYNILWRRMGRHEKAVTGIDVKMPESLC